METNDFRFFKWENAVMASDGWQTLAGEYRCRVFRDTDGRWVLRITGPHRAVA